MQCAWSAVFGERYNLSVEVEDRDSDRGEAVYPNRL